MKKFIIIFTAITILVSFVSCEANYNDDNVKTFELKSGDGSYIRPYTTEDGYFTVSIESITRSFEYIGDDETDTRHADILHNFITFTINIEFNGIPGTEEINALGEKNGDIVVLLDYCLFNIYAYVNGSIDKMNNVEVIKNTFEYMYGYPALRAGDSGKMQYDVKVMTEGFNNYPCYLEFAYEYIPYISRVLIPLNFNPDVYTDIPLSK